MDIAAHVLREIKGADRNERVEEDRRLKNREDADAVEAIIMKAEVRIQEKKRRAREYVFIKSIKIQERALGRISLIFRTR